MTSSNKLKNAWTSDEINEIKSYLLKDLILTRELWDFVRQRMTSFDGGKR